MSKTITITVPLEQAERLQNALYAAELAASREADRAYGERVAEAVRNVMRQIAPHV